MSSRSSSPSFSESLLTNTTPVGFTSPFQIDQKELSKAEINELIEKQVQPLWNALRDSMKERAEIKLRIDALETSETNLKSRVEDLENKVENVNLNNDQLVDEIEKIRTENGRLMTMLNEIKISEDGNQGREAVKKENERKKGELEKLRNELGKIGGAGHFWGNDKGIDKGGVRNSVGEKELKKVLCLLAAGEKMINLKEREF